MHFSHTGSPGLGPGPPGPFQRAMSMDGKPPDGPAGVGRRPMLIKQENMMGSPDGYTGNMGVCLARFELRAVRSSVPSNFQQLFCV